MQAESAGVRPARASISRLPRFWDRRISASRMPWGWDYVKGGWYEMMMMGRGFYLSMMYAPHALGRGALSIPIVYAPHAFGARTHLPAGGGP